MHTGEKLGLEWSIVSDGNTSRVSIFVGKDGLTWRQVVEDKGGEVLGDDHHLTPGRTQVAILVLVLHELLAQYETKFSSIALIFQPTTGLYLMLYSVRRELTGGSHWSEMVASSTARMLRLRAGFGNTAVYLVSGSDCSSWLTARTFGST